MSEPTSDEAPGTPELCPPKTRADLELGRLLEALAARCQSEAGAERARELPFLATRLEVEASLREIDEAHRLEERGEGVPRPSVPSIDDAVDRARIGAQLSATELCAVLEITQAAHRLRRFFKAHEGDAPELALACRTSADLDPLSDELDRSFDSDGSLSDSASPRLGELRSERRASRERIVRRLEELIAKHRDLMSDHYWTERDGRWVLPVRADAHERFPGIVHGASAGGGTIFVEPRVIVSMGNRHKVLDAGVRAEEEAVLGQLTAMVGALAAELGEAVAALAHADVRGAEARLVRDLELVAPEIPEGSHHIELLRARHPLLLLDQVEVVPSRLEVRAGQSLVISGPNAGGKTVALKTLGLAALMLRLGLPVAADRGSIVSLFHEVLTDVGDEQSLAKNLSTFSAHVKNLADILGRTAHGTLVLLDEVASGTDPREGEALATAVLESLAARGGAVACTTHYEGLKVRALEDTRFRNASVGFDIERLLPTFRVTLDAPGASSALAVARRFGVPHHLVDRAHALLGDDVAPVATVIERLEKERRELERATAEARREAERLAEARRGVEEERARLANREQASAVREADGLVGGIKRAREELRAAQARLRSKELDPREIAHAEKEIDRVAKNVAIGGPLEQRPAEPEREVVAARELTPGMRVFVTRLRSEAEVLEVLPSGQVRVAAGPLKLLASPGELRRVDRPGKAKAPKPHKPPPAFDAAADPDVPMQTSDNTVDLRGLRAHEALAMAEQFLDRCMGSGRRVAFLIHGHGTGALRQVVRDGLRASRYVERSRPGEPGEGGDGVTVVWLR